MSFRVAWLGFTYGVSRIYIRMFLILRMVYMFVFHGVEEDIRSDNGAGDTSERSDGVAPSSTTSANGHANGTATNGKSQDSGGSSNGGKKKRA